MMTPQILKFVNFTAAQNSKYLENETLIFSSNNTAKNSFLEEIYFKG